MFRYLRVERLLRMLISMMNRTRLATHPCIALSSNRSCLHCALVHGRWGRYLSLVSNHRLAIAEHSAFIPTFLICLKCSVNARVQILWVFRRAS